MIIINFFRASSFHQHCMLREVDTNSEELLLHNNVRWLSKGKVLEHFCSIRKEIAAYLAHQKSEKQHSF